METFDVWVQSFAGDADPAPKLMRIFGIDESTARDLCETAPRRVKRGVARAHADSIAKALRSIGANVEVRATQSAHASASRARISLTNLAPLEEKTGIELAFEPSKATRPVARPAVSSAPAPVQTARVESSASSWTPWLIRLGTGLVIAMIGIGVRMVWRAARTPSGSDFAAASLSSSVPLASFLGRPGASLGVNTDRNRALTVELTRLGATRLLVTNIAPMGDHEVATRLIVELPPSPTARRAIAQAIARFYAHGERVELGDVEMPSPSDTNIFVDFA